MRLIRFFILLAMATVCFCWPVLADTVSIGIDTGGGIMTVASGTGTATVTTAAGSFPTVHVSASGQSVLSSPDLLLSDTIDTVAASGGMIKIWITDQGLTSPTGPVSFMSGFTSNLLPAGWTVNEATFASLTNALYGGTLLAATNFNAIGTNSQITPGSGVNPFSVTEEFTLTASGAGSTNDTIDLAGTPIVISTPEPAAVMLVGFGLVGLGFSLVRRREL